MQRQCVHVVVFQNKIAYTPRHLHCLSEVPLVRYLHHVSPYSLVVLGEHWGGVLHLCGARSRGSFVSWLRSRDLVATLYRKMCWNWWHISTLNGLVQHAEHPALVAEFPGLPRVHLVVGCVLGNDFVCFFNVLGVSFDAVVALIRANPGVRIISRCGERALWVTVFLVRGRVLRILLVITHGSQCGQLKSVNQ